MRTASIIGALAGLLFGTALVGYFGFAEVWHALSAVGWIGFGIVLFYHLSMIGLLGCAWRVLVPGTGLKTLGIFVWARLIRDSAAEVLPLSQIGGYVFGARTLAFGGIAWPVAMASSIVDVTLELLGQLVYTALGLTLLIWFKPDTQMARPLLLGLAAAAVIALAFIIVQRRGIGLVEHLAGRLARRQDGDAARRPVQSAIHAIYRAPRGLWLGFLLHLASWIASSFEAWVALRFMGTPLAPAAVLAMESLLYAIRSVAFAVPNAVGVQEGAYVMLGGIFGLGPEAAIALSLLKRGRDLVIGVPALLVWQMAEGGRAWRRQRSTSGTDAPARPPMPGFRTDRPT